MTCSAPGPLRTLLLVVAAGPLLSAPAAAQAPKPQQSPIAAPRKGLRAAPAAGEVRIDGRFDEPAWAGAEVAGEFTQASPAPGAPATERTEARVLVGSDAVYVAMRMYDSRPDSIAAPLARRDAGGLYSDRAHVFLDSRNDQRSAFNFSVNPRGVKQDAYLSDDRNEDASWDAVWEVATTVDSLGWTAEFRIPFSQLRFGAAGAEGRAWGLGLHRDVARKQERSTWTPWTSTDPGFVSRFGVLTGLDGVRAPGRLEILPYTTARLTRAPAEPGNPFYQANAGSTAVGADLKVGLPLGLTLSATVNPDFGQVEVDPAEVNLTAFETFFPERRPFFTEGSDVFRFGETFAFSRYAFQQYFYSRRIGRAPQGAGLLQGPGTSFVDAPAQTTILGAAKVSGRTPGGWSVGLMDAVTGRETGRYLDRTGVEGTAPVEPLSNYLVGRVRRDFNAGATVVGALATATNRRMADSAFAPLLHSGAYLAGVDFEHRWARRAWSLGGYLAGSYVTGSQEAIAVTQGRAARYYARPDAGHVELDPTRTSLGGHMGELALARQGSWDGSVLLKQVSPGFEINDLGFQGRTDYRSISTMLGRRVPRTRGVFRNHAYFATANGAWNFDGDRTFTSAGVGANGTFTNFWNAGFRAVLRPEFTNDRLTRGGPVALSPREGEINLSLSTDGRKPLSVGGDVSYVVGADGGEERTLGLSLDLRPSSAARVRVGPRLYRGELKDQFVRAGADPTARDTYGTRYLFAELEQTTFSVDTRVDWTFTPDLSLQLFAQPYVSAGDYADFKAFRTPGRFDFDRYQDAGACGAGGSGSGATLCRQTVGGASVYTADADGAGEAPGLRFRDPDFTFRSLRGNAVLRWEYRPGSTLFFVWQQDRASRMPLGDFDFARDYGALFREPARNVFLVKATYWFGK